MTQSSRSSRAEEPSSALRIETRMIEVQERRKVELIPLRRYVRVHRKMQV